MLVFYYILYVTVHTHFNYFIFKKGFGTPQTGGIGGSGSLFSSTFGSSPAIGGFGTPPTLGSYTTAALNLAGTNMTGAPKQPFQLQKPPPSAKRGKR